MPLVKAKCTNCGASLEVDNTKDAAVCPFCKTPYVIEKAINYYYTTNNNNIKADVVNIYSGSEADFVIRAGMLEKYNGASTTVIIPNGVVGIGYQAFANCKGLESVTIPDSVTQIGRYAFANCGLTSITIPDSVTQIEHDAFAGCERLESVTISNNVTEIEKSVFVGCGLTSITIPDSVTQIGDMAFCRCENLKSVTIPDSVTQIGNHAFANCENLKSVTIPDSVIKIGFAFGDCPIVTINASESWKRKNYNCFDKLDCLKDYVPEPVSQSNNGCYIATCVYGSYDCPQVWTLRRFRDYVLDETWYGRLFVKCYYSISPTLVKWFGETKWFKLLWKVVLDKLVAILNYIGIKDTVYNDKHSFK